jgi:hypothetical protein
MFEECDAPKAADTAATTESQLRNLRNLCSLWIWVKCVSFKFRALAERLS